MARRRKQDIVPTYPQPHRQLCARYAAYLLREAPWVEVATFETQLPSSRGRKRGVADVIALRTGWTTKSHSPKSLICEIKVGRGDLLSDLRDGKMLKYEPWGQCTLVLSHDAAAWSRHNKASLLEELEQKGLPNHWGVVLVPNGWDGRSTPNELRRPKNKKAPTALELQKLVVKVMRSLSYRCLRGGQHLD